MKILLSKKPSLKITLKLQLVLLFIGLLTVVIVFMMSVVNARVYSIVTRNTEQERLNIFRMIENDIKAFTDSMNKMIYSIILSEDVQEFSSRNVEFTAEDVALRQKIGATLDNYLIFNSEVNSILIQTSFHTQIGTERTFSYDKSGNPIKDPSTPEIPSVEVASPKWKFVQFDSYAAKKNFNQYGLSCHNRFYGLQQVFYTDITINVNERGFRKLYERYNNDAQSSLYICDAQGKMISNRRISLLQSIPALFDQIDQKKQSGSFVYEMSSHNAIQVIYQVMSDTGWIIVQEVPLKVYRSELDQLQKSLLPVFLGSILCAILLSVLFIKKITTPLRLLMDAMGKMRQGDVGYQMENPYKNEFHEIIGHFNEMSRSIEEHIQNNKNIEHQKMRYAMSALTSQINPHFIFNTINMIRWMAIAQKATGIRNSLDMLLALLKPLFKDKGTSAVIREELVYAQNYMNLINLRYSANIILTCDLPEEVLDLSIPRFIFQPLIENCIEHGFPEDKSGGEIKIYCEQTDGLQLFIQDNGIGMSNEELQKLQERLHSAEDFVENGNKIGVANVHTRLRLKYGENYGLEFQQAPLRGTIVMIKLPLI